MNLLFVTNKNVYPIIGGIERITCSLAVALSQLYGHRCHSLYTQENEQGGTTEQVFETKNLIPSENPTDYIARLIDKENIDIVIAQGADSRVNNLMPQLRQAVNTSRRHPRLLFVFHNMPGFELPSMDYGVLLYRILHGQNLKKNLKQLFIQTLYPLLKPIMLRRIAPKYIIPYNTADKVVLLSESFIPQYNAFVSGDETHYAAIPNMLSFRQEQCIAQPKEKIVLMVTRLEERHKRVLTALKVWQHWQPQDWKLCIVGYGEDMDYYKRWVKKQQLKNVFFEGLQDPLPYYRKSSFFLMTSAFEGWGLTITEAMQNGCIPVAFDTFTALRDIITDRSDGYIIPDAHIEAYIEALNTTASNPDLLNQMQETCRQSSLRFSAENVAERWNNLFESII